LVVPTQFLESCFNDKRISKGKYHFYFRFEDGKVLEDRDKRNMVFDYTSFLNRWDLLGTKTSPAREPNSISTQKTPQSH
jgi:hypothetical protein